MTRFHVAILVALACFGCSARVPKNDLGRIVVREFEVDPTVTMISAYDAPTADLGMQVAKRIVAVLEKRGRTAIAVPRDSEDVGDLLVTGRITRIDGGSRGERAFTSAT